MTQHLAHGGFSSQDALNHCDRAVLRIPWMLKMMATPGAKLNPTMQTTDLQPSTTLIGHA
jgi:hypothetical protein